MKRTSENLHLSRDDWNVRKSHSNLNKSGRRQENWDQPENCKHNPTFTSYGYFQFGPNRTEANIDDYEQTWTQTEVRKLHQNVPVNYKKKDWFWKKQYGFSIKWISWNYWTKIKKISYDPTEPKPITQKTFEFCLNSRVSNPQQKDAKLFEMNTNERNLSKIKIDPLMKTQTCTSTKKQSQTNLQ